MKPDWLLVAIAISILTASIPWLFYRPVTPAQLMDQRISGSCGGDRVVAIPGAGAVRAGGALVA